MSKALQIVIPVRKGGNAYTTLSSLGKSAFQDFDIVVVQDEWGNANMARNAGATGDSEFLLFSDDDIEWEPDGVGAMIDTLKENPDVSFAYGAYAMGGKTHCWEEWNPHILRMRNYISTMSVIRRSAFPGWDESLCRLQDWDLWLTMARLGRVGKQVAPRCFRIFSTGVRDGITRNGKVSYEEAYRIVKEKHA
jgi:glycosyltransferase involved in cell wall biosynthesis